MAMEFGNVVHIMNHELLATCGALGYLEGDTYQKEPDALETVKDLIRFLRREDDTCEIRRQLGNAQILQNDLIYLLKQHSKDAELFETCIRLVVNLTQPAELCFGNKVPEDKTTRNYYLEVLAHLQAYKQAFADEELMVVLAKKMKKLLDMEWESRREDHTMLMERILLLVRNVLHVPADPTQEKRTDDDASVHDQVLWALNVSGMDKLILYVASSEEEQQWCMHAIEITSLMLREQTPEQLAKAGITRASSEKKKDENELDMARQREIAEKKARILKGSARHSRFGGTFYVKNFKSISERDVIYHQAPQNAKQISFDREKNPKKIARNRMPMKDTSLIRRSTLSIRLFLREFCELFLEECYNPLMHAVKDHILHQKAQENDDTYYLWAMRFLMEFSRHYHFRVDVISETFSVQAFYYVQSNLTKYMDMMITDKKEAAVWSKRMHYALKAYRELVSTLDTMTKAKDAKIRESARVIQSNLFYVVEYREMFVTLLKKYDNVKCTKSFLIDLVETTHIFLKMLEKYCKGKNTILVQKKGRKKNKRRRRNQAANQQQHREGPSEEELNDGWDHVSSDLSAMLQGREDIPENVVPFDAASEQPIEEQRADAMVRIQRGLHNGQAGDAIALFRAAREVWPAGDIFGANDISPEDEFMALREIHFTNLNVAPAPVEEPEMEMEEDEEDEMAEMEREVRVEEEFDFKAYALRFNHPDVIRCYVAVMHSYRTNTVSTNHCAVKMLHRISFDQGDAPLLYQLSLFRVFQKLLNDPVSKLAQFKELAKFGKYVVSKFFEMAAKNKKMFVEILFWKSRQDLYELDEGYGSVRQTTKTGNVWNEDEVAELKQLHDEHKDKLDPEGDIDIVDKIMEHILDDTRTRKQIINQLVELGFAEVTDFKRKKPGWRAHLWREEQELEVKILYDRYKDSNDPLGDILENLSHKRSKVKVADKLISLGCVESKSQLYKKRGRKGSGDGEGKKRRRRKNYSEDEGDEEENEDDRNFIEEGDEVDDDWKSDVESGSERGAEEEKSESSEEEEEEAGDEDGVSIESLVAKVTKKGFSEQMKWIQDGLRSTANDREADGDDQPIPLVPLAEDQENAMASKLFKKFLKKIGLAPPSTHEEMFWRIPSNLTPEQLRSAADSIEPPKSSTRHNRLKEMATQRKKEKGEGKDRTKRKNKRRSRPERMKKDEALKRIQDASDDSDSSRVPSDKESEEEKRDDEGAAGEDDGGSQKVQRSQGRSKRALQSDSSDSEDDEFSMRTLVKKTRGKKKDSSQPKKRSRLMSSDDDSDDEEPMDVSQSNQQDSQPSSRSQPSQGGSVQSSNKSSTKRSSIQSDSDSDDDMPLSMKKTISKPNSDSDSDKENNPTKKSSTKRSAPNKSSALDSDSDDDLPSTNKSSKSSSFKKSKSRVDSDSDSDDDLPSTNKSSKSSSSKKSASRVDSVSDSDNDLPSANKSSKSSSSKKSKSRVDSDLDSDEDLPSTNKSSKSSSSKKSASRVNSDSDSDEDLPSTNNSSKSSSSKKSASRVDSDSDSDTELPSTNKSSKSSSSKKSTSKVDSDSDDDLPSTNKSNASKKSASIVDSDSDSDDDLPLAAKSSADTSGDTSFRLVLNTTDSDDDVPPSSSKSQTKPAGGEDSADVQMEEVNPSQVESESDSEDDMPLRKVARRHILESDSDDD